MLVLETAAGLEGFEVETMLRKLAKEEHSAALARLRQP